MIPDDLKVIKETLADYGFVMQCSRLEDVAFTDVIAALGNSINTPSTVLITLRSYQHMGDYMVSLQTDGAHSFKKVCPDLRPKNMGWCTVTHVWIRRDDGIDRSPFLRKAVNRHKSSPKRKILTATYSLLHTPIVVPTARNYILQVASL